MAKYTVHGRHNTTVGVPAEMADGTVVTGNMPVAIIELVPLNSWECSITLTKSLANPADRDAVNALFVVGNVVELGNFTLISAQE